MATTTNILMAHARGSIAKQVVFKKYGDKTVICNYPDMSNRVLSEKQLKVNAMMKEANKYAKAIMKNRNKVVEAQVRLNVTRNKLYTSLIREYFQKNMPPKERVVAHDLLQAVNMLLP